MESFDNRFTSQVDFKLVSLFVPKYDDGYM